MSARTALAIFFALLAAAAVAGLWWAWHHPPQLAMPTTAPANPPLTASGGAAFEMPALAHYAEVVERPVFIEARRPPDNEAETAPPPPADPAASEPLRLIGVLLLPGRAAALILPEEPDPAVANDPALKKRIPRPSPTPQKHKVMRVPQGGTINGWVLETVQADKVTLRKGGDLRELALLRPPKTKPRPSDGEPNPPAVPGSIPPPIPPPPTVITPPAVVPPTAPGSPTSGL